MRLHLVEQSDRSVLEKVFSFETEEEFTAWENERIRTFGNGWSFVEEAMHANEELWVDAKLQFKFLRFKTPRARFNRLANKEWCNFVLRHKHALCFYDECSSFTILGVSDLSKMSDEEILELHAKDPVYCDVNGIRDLVIPLDDNSWVDFIESKKPDGSKDYFIEFSCFN